MVHFTGGTAHIGAVALARPGDKSGAQVLTVPGHKEDTLALEAAHQLAMTLRCTVCVSAGIHYDAITPNEITQILTMVRALTERCCKELFPAIRLLRYRHFPSATPSSAGERKKLPQA